MAMDTVMGIAIVMGMVTAMGQDIIRKMDRLPKRRDFLYV